MSIDPKDLELIRAMRADPEIRRLSHELFDKMCEYRYSYNFSWLGRPIIQFPQDIVAIQEILWSVKPDLVVETGIAHGGSLILSASILELIGTPGLVVGIDVDIRAHNRAAIESHPLMDRVVMIEGSSIDPGVVKQVHELAQGKRCPLIILDSNHTHAHVLRELELYSPLVRKGSYVVVMDTVIEDMAPDFFPDRPWGRGDNPKTAVREFLSGNRRFNIDLEIEAKLLMTVAPEGYLKCVED
jgi:cephalosporin hydroxylase